jgi:dihydroneopterin aldolase
MESHGNGIESSAEIELRGLSVYTHHGVSEAEQEVGQRLEFDISFDVPDCDAVLTDRLEDTVDYAQVCDIVVLAAAEGADVLRVHDVAEVRQALTVAAAILG